MTGEKDLMFSVKMPCLFARYFREDMSIEIKNACAGEVHQPFKPHRVKDS